MTSNNRFAITLFLLHILYCAYWQSKMMRKVNDAKNGVVEPDPEKEKLRLQAKEMIDGVDGIISERSLYRYMFFSTLFLNLFCIGYIIDIWRLFKKKTNATS